MTDHDDPRKQEETDDDEPIQMERPADDASPARNESLGGVDGAPQASGWAGPSGGMGASGAMGGAGAGGPIGATNTLVIELYRRALVYRDLGQAAAVGMVGLSIAILVTMVYFRLTLRAERAKGQ